jgi:hypothetical protein
MNSIKKFFKLIKNKELRDTIKSILAINAKEHFHLPIRPGDFVIAFLMYNFYWIPLNMLRYIFLESNRVTENKEFRPWLFSVFTF